MKLSVNTILQGKWYSMGEEIDAKIVPANLRKYALPPANKSSRPGRHLNFELNKPYRLDGEGYLRGRPAAQQAAQMEAEVSEDEMIADEIAEAEVNETVASAIESAREDLQAEVEKEKVQARARAEQGDAAEDFLREEQDAEVKSGEFDRFDSVPGELTAVNSEQAEDSPERGAAPGSVKGKPKLKVKGKRSFVRRGQRFVPATSVEDLIEGEVLYRHRAKSFGVAAKYIAFAKVRKETE